MANANRFRLSEEKLEEKSKKIRIDILHAIHQAGKGHIGGAYSIVDVLVSLYFGSNFSFDPMNPEMGTRDRFILSKGHAAIALYAILADLGYFPSEELTKLNTGNLLSEHPDPGIPGVEVVSGSLGHGLSIAAGMALANKLDGNERKSLVLIGDGECYEGSIWEGALFAAHHNLNNLCGIIDRNRLITHGSTEVINRLEPFKQKWESFGWNVVEVDAHNFKALQAAWEVFYQGGAQTPTMIIANSVKGKGIKFMENEFIWHHGGISEDQLKLGLSELKGIEAKC
jgi:transketolase